MGYVVGVFAAILFFLYMLAFWAGLHIALPLWIGYAGLSMWWLLPVWFLLCLLNAQHVGGFVSPGTTRRGCLNPIMLVTILMSFSYGIGRGLA